MESLKDLGIAGIAMMLGVIGWFLRNKDEAQGKQISALWEKHDEDAKALADLRERIAREHYLKSELDARFVSLESTFREGINKLSDDIRNLTQVMLGHIENERLRKKD